MKTEIGAEDISTSHNLYELEADTLLLKTTIKDESNETYREVLENITPNQIVQGIQGFGFDKMSRAEITAHDARDLMIQLSCNILGENTIIDSIHGKGTTQDVIDTQKKLGIQADGDAGPLFFKAVVAYIQKDSTTTPQIQQDKVTEGNDEDSHQEKYTGVEGSIQDPFLSNILTYKNTYPKKHIKTLRGKDMRYDPASGTSCLNCNYFMSLYAIRHQIGDRYISGKDIFYDAGLSTEFHTVFNENCSNCQEVTPDIYQDYSSYTSVMNGIQPGMLVGIGAPFSSTSAGTFKLSSGKRFQRAGVMVVSFQES